MEQYVRARCFLQGGLETRDEIVGQLTNETHRVCQTAFDSRGRDGLEALYCCGAPQANREVRNNDDYG